MKIERNRGRIEFRNLDVGDVFISFERINIRTRDFDIGDGVKLNAISLESGTHKTYDPFELVTKVNATLKIE